MRLAEAISLIKSPEFTGLQEEKWADLGCGSGLFTTALSHILKAGSTIYAVDQNISSLHIVSGDEKTNIIPKELNFETHTLNIENLDGILMANALHFVRGKKEFLEKIRDCFREKPRFVIVEYETGKPNPWVPFPIGFSDLPLLFTNIGCNSVIKTGEMNSRYRSGKLYSALIY